MKRDAHKEVLADLEKELTACGFPSRKKIRTLMHGLAKGKASRGAAFADGLLAAVAEGIYANTRKHQFRTDAEVDRWREQIRGARYTLRPALAKLLETTKALIPRSGGPGRPIKLNDVEKRLVCSLVVTYIRNGMITSEAIKQVAQDKKVSMRTLWKIWKERGST